MSCAHLLLVVESMAVGACIMPLECDAVSHSGQLLCI